MDKLQQVRDFLENTVKEKGLSLNALSLKLGKNSTYLFHFIKRHSPKRLDETTRRNLAQILNVDEQSLCDFPLPTGLIQDKFSALSSLFNFAKNKEPDLIAIDVWDMDGPKKGRFELLKENIIGQIFLSPQLIRAFTPVEPQNLVIIKAAGESMSPTINSGDMIWLDTSCSMPAADGIYMLNASGDVIIRRLQINPFDGSIEVSSDNKAYRSFNMKDHKNLHVCGKVLFVTNKLV